MKNILLVGHNELRLFLKARTSYLWLFGIPLMFMGVMSLVSYGPGKAQNRFPPVLVENHDTGATGSYFVDLLTAQGLWRLDPEKDKSNKPVSGIIIPADFTARLKAKQDTKLEYSVLDATRTADAALIEARVVRALIRLNSDLFEASAATGGTAFPSPEALKALREKPDPVVLDATYAGRDPVPTGSNFSVPGNLVNFLMMNLLIFGGTTVAASRRSGTLRRLMTLPVRRSELIAGQIYGLWLLGLVQVGFFLLVGKFVFHVSLGANLPGVMLVLFVFAWVAAALGVLVGSALDAPDRVVGVCVFASLMLAALGGCWFPLEITPDWMKIVAHCVPTGWAMDALSQLISFGHGLGSVVTPLLVLAGCAIAATAAAAKCFRV
jgi:ABC-2 type transport system permease protein